eukprot:401020_1
MSKKRKIEEIDNTTNTSSNAPLKKQKSDETHDQQIDNSNENLPDIISLSSELKAEIISFLPLDQISDIDDHEKFNEFNEICKNASRHHEIMLSVDHFHREHPEFSPNYDDSAIQINIKIHPNDLFQDNWVTYMIRKYWKQVRYVYVSTKTKSLSDLYLHQNILHFFLNKCNLKLTFVTLLSFNHEVSHADISPKPVPSILNYDLNYLSSAKQLKLIHIPLCDVQAWNVITRNLPNLRYLNLNLNAFQMNNNIDVEVCNAKNLWSLSIGRLTMNNDNEQHKYQIIPKLLAAAPNVYHFRLDYNFWNVYNRINYDITIPINNIISLRFDHNWSRECTDHKLSLEIIKQCPNLQHLSIPVLLNSAQGINWMLQLILYFVNKNIKNNKYLQLTWHDDSVYSPHEYINNIHHCENIEQKIELIYKGLRDRLINEYKCDMKNIENCIIVARKKTENDRTKRVVCLRKFITMVLGREGENIYDTKHDTFVSLVNTINLLQSNQEFRQFSKFTECVPNFFFVFM